MRFQFFAKIVHDRKKFNPSTTLLGLIQEENDPVYLVKTSKLVTFDGFYSTAGSMQMSRKDIIKWSNVHSISTVFDSNNQQKIENLLMQ